MTIIQVYLYLHKIQGQPLFNYFLFIDFPIYFILGKSLMIINQTMKYGYRTVEDNKAFNYYFV